MATVDLALAIGGAAGQGIATPGNILARILVRRGLHVRVDLFRYRVMLPCRHFHGVVHRPARVSHIRPPVRGSGTVSSSIPDSP